MARKAIRQPVQALGAAAVSHIVDAIQGLGALTLDLSTLDVDILACGCQKWLISPWGTGFVYVRKALIAQLEPWDVGWMSV